MKILTIMCSHRKNKNTQTALNYLLEGMPNNEIKSLKLNEMNLNICKACEYCRKNFNKCIFNDDMEEIVSSVAESDLVIIATPVYFNSVTTLFKVLIDRTQMLFNVKYVQRKDLFPGKKQFVILSTGGQPPYNNQFIGISYEIEHFLKNFNGELLEFIKIPNTDREPIKDRELIREELIQKGNEIILKAEEVGK